MPVRQPDLAVLAVLREHGEHREVGRDGVLILTIDVPAAVERAGAFTPRP